MSPLTSSSELSTSETSNVESTNIVVAAKPANANFNKCNNNNISNSETISCSHSLPLHWTHYTPLRVLGAGGFGVVYLCVNHYYYHGANNYSSTKEKKERERESTNNKNNCESDLSTSISLYTEEYVAVKAIPLSELTDEEVMLTMNEVALLEHLHHPNIIRYLDCFMDSEREQLCLVTEFVDGGDVGQMIKAVKRKQQNSEDTKNRKTINDKVQSNIEYHHYSKEFLQECYNCEQLELNEEEAAAAAAELVSEMETDEESAAHNDKNKHRTKRSREGMCETHGSRENSLFAKRQHVKLSSSTDLFTSCSNNCESNETKCDMGSYNDGNKSFDVTWMSDASYRPNTPMSATAWWEAERCNNHSTIIDKTFQPKSSETNEEKKWENNNAIKNNSESDVTYQNREKEEKKEAEHIKTYHAHNKEQQETSEQQEWIASFTIIDILRQCLEGLKYLHTLHILHRDIKPSNIYITQRGQVKIGDFGIAKLLNKDDPFTNTFIGTPFYLSPELCWGEAYSFTSDIWSLGVVGYELYTLHLPFVAHNVLAQIHCVTEGQYDHALLEQPHFFSPTQALELSSLYGYDAITKEGVLHELLVRLVESMLTNTAAERPMANELLETYFECTSPVDAYGNGKNNENSGVSSNNNCSGAVRRESPNKEEHHHNYEKCTEADKDDTNTELNKIKLNTNVQGYPDLLHGSNIEERQGQQYECEMQKDENDCKERPRSRWREMFSRHGRNKKVNNKQNELRSDLISNSLQSSLNHINAWWSSWGNESNMEISTNFVQLTPLSTLSNVLSQETYKKENLHMNEFSSSLNNMIKLRNSSSSTSNGSKEEVEEEASLLSSLANRVECSFGALCSFLPLSRRENVIHGARLWSRRHSHERLGMQSSNSNNNNVINNTNAEGLAKYYNHIVPYNSSSRSSSYSGGDANYVHVREERSNSANRNEINILTFDSNENFSKSFTMYESNNGNLAKNTKKENAAADITNTNEKHRQNNSYCNEEHILINDALHRGSYDTNNNNNITTTHQVSKSVEQNLEEMKEEQPKEKELEKCTEETVFEEENVIPWLYDAEAFQAIPLSEGSEDVVLVERAQQNSISIHGDVVVVINKRSSADSNSYSVNNTVSNVVDVVTTNTTNSDKKAEDKATTTTVSESSINNKIINSKVIQEIKKEDDFWNKVNHSHHNESFYTSGNHIDGKSNAENNVNRNTRTTPEAEQEKTIKREECCRNENYEEIDLSTSPQPKAFRLPSVIDVNSQINLHNANRKVNNTQNKEDREHIEGALQTPLHKLEHESSYNNTNEMKETIVVRSMSRRGQSTRTELYPKSQLLKFNMNESNKATSSSFKKITPENEMEQDTFCVDKVETKTMTNSDHKLSQQMIMSASSSLPPLPPLKSSTISSLSVLGRANELSCSKLTSLLRAKVRARQLQQRLHRQRERQHKKERWKEQGEQELELQKENSQIGKTQNKLNRNRTQDDEKTQVISNATNNNIKYTITTLPSASMQNELDHSAIRNSLRQELTELYKQTYHAIWANHHRRKVGVFDVSSQNKEIIGREKEIKIINDEMNSECNPMNDCMSVQKKMRMSDHPLMSTRTLPFYENDRNVQSFNDKSFHERMRASEITSNRNNNNDNFNYKSRNGDNKRIERITLHKVSMPSDNPLGTTLTQGKHIVSTTSPSSSLRTSEQINLVHHTELSNKTEQELQNTKQYIMEANKQTIYCKDKSTKLRKVSKECKMQHMTELPSTTLHLYPPKELDATCVYHEKTEDNNLHVHHDNNNSTDNDAFARQQRRLSNEMKVRNKLRRRTSAPQQRLNNTLSFSSMNNSSVLQQNEIHETTLKENAELSIVGIQSICNKPKSNAKPNSSNYKPLKCENECIRRREEEELKKNSIDSINLQKEENELEQLRLYKSNEHRIRPICSAPLLRTLYNHNLLSYEHSASIDTTTTTTTNTTPQQFINCSKHRNSCDVVDVRVEEFHKQQMTKEQEKYKEQHIQEKNHNDVCKSTHDSQKVITPFASESSLEESSTSVVVPPYTRKDQPSRELLDTTIESVLNEAQTRRYIQERCHVKKKDENNSIIPYSAHHTNVFDNTHSANSLSSHATFHTNTSCNSIDKYGLSDNLESERSDFIECNVHKVNNTINYNNDSNNNILHDETDTAIDASCAMLEIIHAARQAATIDVNVANFAKHEPPRLALSQNVSNINREFIHYDKYTPCLWESSSVEDDSEDDIIQDNELLTSNSSSVKILPNNINHSEITHKNNLNKCDKCDEYVVEEWKKYSRRGIPCDRPDEVEVTYRRRLSASLTASSCSSSSSSSSSSEYSSSTSTSSETSSLCSEKTSYEVDMCDDKDKQHKAANEECISTTKTEESYHESNSSLEDSESDMENEEEGKSEISRISHISDSSDVNDDDDRSSNNDIYDLEFNTSWNVTNTLPMFIIRNQEATEVRSFDNNNIVGSSRSNSKNEQECEGEESLSKYSESEVDANNDHEPVAENATIESESLQSSSTSSSSSSSEEESLTFTSFFIHGDAHGTTQKCDNHSHYYPVELNKKTKKRLFDYNLPVTLEIVTELPVSLMYHKSKLAEQAESLCLNEEGKQVQQANSEISLHVDSSSHQIIHRNLQDKTNSRHDPQVHEDNLHEYDENEHIKIENESEEKHLSSVEHNSSNCEEQIKNFKIDESNAKTSHSINISDKVMCARITSDLLKKPVSQVKEMTAAINAQLPLDKQENELSIVGVSKPINYSMHGDNKVKRRNTKGREPLLIHKSSVLSNTNAVTTTATTSSEINYHGVELEQYNEEKINDEVSKQNQECVEHDMSSTAETTTAFEQVKTVHTIPLRLVRSRTRLSGLIWRIRYALHAFGLSTVAQKYIPPHKVNEQHAKNQSANIIRYRQSVTDLLNTNVTNEIRNESNKQNRIHVDSNSSSSQIRSYTQANNTDIREQLALMPLYFYQQRSALMHQQILIHINSEGAWQTIQQLWSDNFAQRPFMRLYLVVETS